MIATIVEWEAVRDTVLASVVAGIGVTLVFSIAIWGVARFLDYGRDDRPIAAGAAGGVAALGLLATAAALVVGILVMTSN
jgi:hypothetical protein